MEYFMRMEVSFIKDHISQDINLIGGTIKASVPLLIGTISQKYALFAPIF